MSEVSSSQGEMQPSPSHLPPADTPISGPSERRPAPPTWPDKGRFAARLATFTHQELLDFAAEACSKSAEARRLADARLAKHAPLPEWAVNGVLLSIDLLPQITRFFGGVDGVSAVASVCKAWSEAWKQLLDERRILHPVPLPRPDFTITNPIDVVELPVDREEDDPDKAQLLAVTCRGMHEVFICDRQMRVVNRLGISATDPRRGSVRFSGGGPCALASCDEGLYVAEQRAPARIRRFHQTDFRDLYTCTSPGHCSIDDMGARLWHPSVGVPSLCGPVCDAYARP